MASVCAATSKGLPVTPIRVTLASSHAVSCPACVICICSHCCRGEEVEITAGGPIGAGIKKWTSLPDLRICCYKCDAALLSAHEPEDIKQLVRLMH